ncbi:MAG: hypothetical protein RL238_512 [Actinomycetota bacterium]|jgi:polyhydroxybutyrate depolymerase
MNALRTALLSTLLLVPVGCVGARATFVAPAPGDGSIVTADGPDETARRTWNAGGCCGAAARKDVDDVAFIDALIDEMMADHHIDADRVYVVGHSNGGFMAYPLACELSDRIAAVGLQAGGLMVDTCAPERPVSLLHVHGRDDTNVPLDGGRGSGLARVEFPAVDASASTVADAMGCAGTAGTVVDGIVEFLLAQ